MSLLTVGGERRYDFAHLNVRKTRRRQESPPPSPSGVTEFVFAVENENDTAWNASISVKKKGKSNGHSHDLTSSDSEDDTRHPRGRREAPPGETTLKNDRRRPRSLSSDSFADYLTTGDKRGWKRVVAEPKGRHCEPSCSNQLD